MEISQTFLLQELVRNLLQDALQRHTYIGKIRLRRFVFRPSGTQGEPHEVTAPFSFICPMFTYLVHSIALVCAALQSH